MMDNKEEKRGKRWVILKPCEMHLDAVSTSECTLYAGLWDITSSDNATHDKFCKLAINSNVFSFGNIGIRVEEDIPYTFNDGSNSKSWLISIFRMMIEALSYGINVKIELDKSLMVEYDLCLTKSYGISFKEYEIDNKTKDDLYNTYCIEIMKVAYEFSKKEVAFKSISDHIIFKEKNLIKDTDIYNTTWKSNDKLAVIIDLQRIIKERK